MRYTAVMKRRWWLWVALTLAVGALAALAWRLMRDVGRAPAPPGGGAT